MANEAVIVNLGNNAGNPQDFTVADGQTITKGQLLWLSGARSVSGASTTAPPFAGIATSDKEAGDGALNVSCYTPGSGAIFDLYCIQAFTEGDTVCISGQNMISGCGTNYTSETVGKALEDGAIGSRAEVII